MKEKFFLLTILFLLSPSFLFAELVFLKNGKILKGKIKGESSASISFIDNNDIAYPVPRAKILRILYKDNLPQMKYIYFKGGGLNYRKVYIVDENNSYYTVRSSLFVNKEWKISKNRINSISLTPISDRGGAVSASKNSWNFRAGLGLFFSSTLHVSNIADVEGEAVDPFDINLGFEPVIDLAVIRHEGNLVFGLSFAIDKIPEADFNVDSESYKFESFSKKRFGFIVGMLVDFSNSLQLESTVSMQYSGGTMPYINEFNEQFNTSYDPTFREMIIAFNFPLIFGKIGLGETGDKKLSFYVGPRFEFVPIGGIEDFADIKRNTPSFSIIGGVNISL